MAIETHRVTSSDIELFADIADGVFDEPIRANRLQAYLGEPTNLLIVACEDSAAGQRQVVGQCAGVLHMHPDRATELYLDELATATQYRRRGIGRKMLREMIAWGRECGCESCWFATELDNAEARGLYEAEFGAGDEIVMFEFLLK